MKNNILAGLIAVAVASPLLANASDGTITFAGSVTANTCTIKVNDGTATNTVTLPTVASSQLTAKGNTAGQTEVRIGLSACSDTVKTARAFFESGPNVSADHNLTNKGTASNVEVQLLTPTSTVIAIGDTAQRAAAATTLTSGAAVMTYKAQYYATAAATAGSVDTSVTYSIDYL
ncbi:type 1 fimbrial protein [Serratia proteamaculans]|uniref:fimbrial protein n=1 Tax=Serratia proteamaculans TaxID=28151 RepID=UPI001076B604|nr:type 1 fimbrial protein [Serratia proteamaculans]TFZ50987.1 type 1 fimbrial protein [Serratia proteamaculans]